MKPIAHIRTDFPAKFGIPRQSGLAETQGIIIFEKEYRTPEAFRGLEEFSHIWLLWEFSEAKRDKWQPTVRPPLLGGNKRMGVFATRSPFRPNPIGLSCVRLDKIESTSKYGTVLYIGGADLMDGTPIYDIKPYLAYTDSHPDAKGGFTEALGDSRLTVIIPDEIKAGFAENKLQSLLSILEQDPRPQYIDDPERIYGFNFAGYEIKFKVNGKTLTVVSTEKAE
ncbi:MAG: tRNA (N6-threonylcarbamoyladenosine(37)-N6)-methyltransferase TrmO [Ruminococcaceae bacterium]|nr:tRNA (N6-threonylcarbamoyladenosine(37)-N6)-methyltransferase TrmO [Oscillospiraceae bacterium]